MHTLVLMRHGKSGYPEGTPDHDRPLAERGEREAALAGRWIRENVPPIDAVLCSTATRTRQTLTATAIAAHTRYEKQLYGASPEEIIEEIGFTEDTVSTLLVVGHSPGIPWTSLELDATKESSMVDAINLKFPTSAIAVLTFDGNWSDLGSGKASLTHFHVPR